MRKYFNKYTICQLILFIVQTLMVVLCFTLPDVDKSTTYFVIGVECFIFCGLLYDLHDTYINNKF